jgi:hypothetical protein
MTAYEQKKAANIEKARQRKQQETEEFLNSVNVLRNNTDSVTYPSVSIIKETEKCYINYYVVKYPNCLVYRLSMIKKDHPFTTYYSKEYYKNDIPQKYIAQFEELEKYFNEI